MTVLLFPRTDSLPTPHAGDRTLGCLHVATLRPGEVLRCRRQYSAAGWPGVPDGPCHHLVACEACHAQRPRPNLGVMRFVPSGVEVLQVGFGTGVPKKKP